MTLKRTQTVFVFVMFVMAACVEPYPPPASVADAAFLVVDGFLNATTGNATVKLSRSIALDATVPIPPEHNAVVTVEEENGTSFDLTETDDGIYSADDIEVTPSGLYRVHIVTNDGKSYRSDFVEVKQAPAIDSVVTRYQPNGTHFYVSSHDDANNTIYYRYLFTETWEYRVPVYSFWKKVGVTPVFRDPVTEQVFTCWRSTISTEILTTSTKALSKDVVSMFPINYIKRGARQLSRRYTINVQQRAISQDEFEYWSQIRKTTESLGGLFDPLPSQVVGNIRNEEDSQEPVLGYFSGGFVSEKRIFLSNGELPGYLQAVDPYDFICEARFIPIDNPELIGGDTYVEQIGQPPVGYTAVPTYCADCRSQGGNNFPPDFWIK
jgi:hypothetical protein